MSEQDRDLVRIAVNEPGESSPTYLGINALPFGAVGSVAGFLRVSVNLWFLGFLVLRVVWSAFFDDFGTISRDELTASTEQTVCRLFDILGVKFAQEGPKASGFAKQFKLLGVVIDLRDFPKGVVRMGHTKERVQEITDEVHGVLEADKLSAKQAEQLRGRMCFFEGFVFGRVPSTALRCIDRAARSGATKGSLPANVVRAMHALLDRLASARPLELSYRSEKTFILFTDGACEGNPKVGSMGGVLIGLRGKPISFFSERVPDSFMQALSENSDNPIFELELLPVLASYMIWGEWIKHSQLVIYIDNNGAKDVLQAATGGHGLGHIILCECLRDENALGIKPWFSRVPSFSNLADPPSRGDVHALLTSGCSWMRVQWEVVLKRVLSRGAFQTPANVAPLH